MEVCDANELDYTSYMSYYYVHDFNLVCPTREGGVWERDRENRVLCMLFVYDFPPFYSYL